MLCRAPEVHNTDLPTFSPYPSRGERDWKNSQPVISYTGIWLTLVSRPLQVGETLLLTFVTTSGKACKLHARVVHTHPTGAGLVFTQAPEAYRQLQGEIAAAFTDIPEAGVPI